VRSRKSVPEILALVAYAAYVCAPILHDPAHGSHHTQANFDSEDCSVVAPGCPDPCDDPTHDHTIHDSDRCPHCQLIATSTAFTNDVSTISLGDDVSVCSSFNDFQIDYLNWFDSTDPIRGPPQA
jgi:hypothetical protein